MILHLIRSYASDTIHFAPKPELIPVDYAHPIPGWLVYRRAGSTGERWIASSSIREAWVETEEEDPDPMRERAAALQRAQAEL